MLIEDFQNLVVPKPPADTVGIKYGDFVVIDRNTTPVADIDEIWGVVETQCEESLTKIRDMRGELPVAIYLYTLPHPDKPWLTMFGWEAWTLKP